MTGDGNSLKASYGLEFGKAAWLGVLPAGLLDMASDLAPLPLPDPINIPDYSGNMAIGGAVAAVVALLYGTVKAGPAAEHIRDITITESELAGFRKWGTLAIVGGVAIANSITETKWGFRTFPAVARVSEFLSGPQPHIWDGVYSTLWAGICANIFWKKRPAI